MAFGMVNVPGLTSVNGHTGDVTLTAKDVGALSDSWKPSLTDMNDALAERKVNGKPLSATPTVPTWPRCTRSRAGRRLGISSPSVPAEC